MIYMRKTKLNQLDFKNIRFLNTINRWQNFKVIEITLECSPLFSISSDILFFIEKYFPACSTQIQHQQGPESIKSFFSILFQIMGCPAHDSEIHAVKNHPNYVYILIAYDELITAEKLVEFAKKCIMHPFDNHEDKLKQLLNIKDEYEDIRMGPSTQHIAQAAEKRHIPIRRIGTGSLLQLGHGYKQRRVQASLIDLTSVIADSIAQDKLLTKEMLKVIGLPVPEGKVVTHQTSALYDADAIGYPLVVKPLDGNQGKGVTVNIQSEQELIKAFQVAKQISDDVLVEQYIEGLDFRLLVVGNELVAAAQRVPPYVVGDGVLTIEQLIHHLNQDVRRLDGHNGVMSKIKIDSILLATLEQQHVNLESIPSVNQNIILRYNSNLSTGGSAIDVTDLVHPSIVRQAVDAARLIGIDVCGIDIVCKDITMPLVNGNGAFIELNLAPGLRMHIAPSVGQSRNVGDAIIQHMVKDDNLRIPVVTITGTNGKTSTSLLLSKVLQDYQKTVGVTCSNGIFLNNECLYVGDCSGPWSAERILAHPKVEVAVLETARGGILRKGLGFDQADVAIITNIGQADHLGLDYIYSAEDILDVKQTVLKTMRPESYAILNADDTLVANLAKNLSCKVIFFSTSATNPLLERHIKQQGTVIYFDENKKHIVLENQYVHHEFDVEHIEYIFNHHALFQIQNTMCVIASIFALKYPLVDLTDKLKHHKDVSPGRFKCYQYSDRTIIADYAHNIDALESILFTIEKIPAKRRLILTSSAGDRQDEIILEQMRLLAEHFDHGVIYQDLCQRNRKDGEVIELIRQGFSKGKRMTNIDEVYHEQKAIEHIILISQPGDLCLLLIDDVDNSLRNIDNFVQESLI